MKPLARHFGVSGVIATRAQVGDDNRYTGALEFYAYGEQKAEAMRELAASQGYDLSASYAYSDSGPDLPMLEAVGHPHVVNPDRELRRLAASRDWPVLVFSKPVALRSRKYGCSTSRACSIPTATWARTACAARCASPLHSASSSA